MARPAHSTRKPWIQHAIVGCAATVVILAVWVSLHGAFWDSAAAFALNEIPAWSSPVALAFCLLGAAIIAVEKGFRPAAWFACLATLPGLLSLAMAPWGPGHAGGVSVAGLFSSEDLLGPEPMPAALALALILAALTVAWQAVRLRPGRIVCSALIGSLLGAMGLLTLLGYAMEMPVACRWGSEISVPPGIAPLLFLTGLALLLIAWRDHRSLRTVSPAWLPVPVVATCGLLTLVFWAGLREREVAYLSTTGQIAINSFASAINLEFERQCSALERIGRRWAPEHEAPVWEADAATWMIDAPGARSLARISPDGSTGWYWPTQGNEALIGFNQFSQPERRQALEAAARSGGPVVSSSLELAGRGPGFVIYAPIFRARTLVAFIGAEFTYREFFASIDQRTKITLHHLCEITIGDRPLYDSRPSLDRAAGRPFALASVFTLQNRRLRISMEPTAGYLRQNRRHLPDIALASGLGITFLLGLSIHLARTARAGLVAAETSNRLLRGENEERRRVETMLKSSDERLRLALDATSIGIFEWNLAAGSLRHSEGLALMLGLPPSGRIGTPDAWRALVHPDDLRDYLPAVGRQLSGEQDFTDLEYRMRGPRGAWRSFYARSKTVAYGPDGKPARIVGTLQDVTSRKESARALRHSQAAARKLSLVASRTDNLVLIGTPDGAIEWVNESFERVLEYRLDEITGRQALDFMAGSTTSRQTLDRVRHAVARGEVLTAEIVVYSKSGRKYHLQLEIQPVHNEHGALENFIAVGADITARVETENALRRAKAEADDASRAKSDFLAAMSHEIRTPMNGVIGMTSLLLDTPLAPGQRDSVNTIRTSGEALLAIINDILDFSKIESGKLELEHQPFDLSDSIEETLDLFAMQASARKIGLAYAIDPALPTRFVGDASRLRQVLSNLVNNAVKFTPGGCVSIEVLPARGAVLSALRPRHRMISIAVRDTGIGIPADRLDRLFKPFSQVDSSITRKYGGTGLGLVICQRLCALMGGSIRVQSDVRHGSTFTVTLQLETAADPSPRPALPAALGQGPVLCAEGNPVVLRRLTAFFQDVGVGTLAAPDTETLLASLRQSPPPVAALLDIELPPAADGTLPHAPLLDRRIPVIALLPSAQAPLPDWTRDAPFAPVVKPLRTFALVRALHALFPAPEDAPVPPPATGIPDLAKEIPLRVLLAEDNLINQKVALRFLERLGYQADTVSNGLEAVNAAANGAYQLIFMDLQMPEMDGLEATRRIRRHLAAGLRPCIVALTANAMPGDRERCLETGMDGFITKPVKLEEIADFIRNHFGTRPGQV